MTLTKFYHICLISLLLFTPSTFAFYEYEWSFEVHSHLEDQMQCSGCQKIMEEAQKQLPTVGALGKPALKAAVLVSFCKRFFFCLVRNFQTARNSLFFWSKITQVKLLFIDFLVS